MITTIHSATPMRPIASLSEEDRAMELFLLAVYDDPEAFAELVPDGSTPKAVAIADDSSAAELDLYKLRRQGLGNGAGPDSPDRRAVLIECAGR
jgi:hypothetical protein